MKRNQPIHKTAPKASPIFRRVVVVLLTLVLSLACYGVTVFAWFQADVLNAGNTIQSGSYGLTVFVVVEDDNANRLPENGGSYLLEAGMGYNVTIAATGTTSGYCQISNGNETWNTVAISGTDIFTLTIYPAATANYTFTAFWGAPPEGEQLSDDDVIGTPPEVIQEEPSAPVEEDTTQPTDPEESVTNPTEAPSEEPTTAPTEETTDPTQPQSQPTEPETAAEAEQ